jgi:hypothetical protein
MSHKAWPCQEDCGEETLSSGRPGASLQRARRLCLRSLRSLGPAEKHLHLGSRDTWPGQRPRPGSQRHQISHPPPSLRAGDRPRPGASFGPSQWPRSLRLHPAILRGSPEARGSPGHGRMEADATRELAKLQPYHGCARNGKRPAFFRCAKKLGSEAARAAQEPRKLRPPPHFPSASFSQRAGTLCCHLLAGG